MARNIRIPQITELDRMLLRGGGWSFSETQDRMWAAAGPSSPGAFRAGAAHLLRMAANWIDAQRGDYARR